MPGGEGAGLSFTLGPSVAAAGAEGRGLAPSCVVRSEGGGGRGGGARGRASRGVSYVVTSAREREREEPSRPGLGGRGRESEAGSERASVQARRGRAATRA